MATTNIKVEAKKTDFDNSSLYGGAKNVRIMEMRLVAQNKNKASITNPNDKRTEDIKAPFSEILKLDSNGSSNDIII